MCIVQYRICVFAKRLEPVDFSLVAVQLVANFTAGHLLNSNKRNSGNNVFSIVVVAGLSSTALKNVVVLELGVSMTAQTTYESTAGLSTAGLSNSTYIDAVEYADEGVVVHITADTASVCTAVLVGDSTIVSTVGIADTVVRVSADTADAVISAGKVIDAAAE